MSFLNDALLKLFGNRTSTERSTVKRSRNGKTYYDPNGHRGFYSSTPVPASDDGLFGSFESMFGADRIGGLLDSLISRITAAHLTGAEKEANKFSAEQAELAFNRELEASNTAKQRQVADLQAAGINPMMAVSQGVSLPSATAATSVSPSAAGFNMSDILDIVRMKELLPLEKESIKANTEKTLSDAEKNRSEKEGIDILNNYRAESEELRLRGERVSQSLDKAKRAQVYQSIREMAADITLKTRQAESEEERKALYEAEKLLKTAQASQIVALLPFEIEYKKAATAAQRQAAALSATNAAYQNRLIDDGYIEAFVANAYKDGALKGIQVSDAQIKHDVLAIKSAFRTGNLPENMQSNVNQVVLDYVLQPLALLLDNFNPISNILGNSLP